MYKNLGKILSILLVIVMILSSMTMLTTNVSAEKANKNEATAMMELPDLEKWHYRIPIIVDAGDYNRTDCVLNQTVNMTMEIGGFGTFDNNSVRVIETLEDGTPEYEAVSQCRWINKNLLDVTWIMNDTTLANTQRYYSIYFDILENGPKNATAYPEYLTIKEDEDDGEENEDEDYEEDSGEEEECKKNLWIISENYEIKINRDRGGSRVVKINNASRKGFVYDNTWQSWHSDSLNWKIKGASAEIVQDGPIYKTFRVISKDETQILYWYFYPDRMKIMFHGEGDISFDTIADNLNNKKGTLIWSDATTEDFTKDYTEYSKNTDFFYILDPELDSANDDVKGRSGFWADTQDNTIQTVLNAGEKGTRWILNDGEAWFGFADNDVIRGVVLSSQNLPEITREYSWIILESPVIEDEKVFENQLVIIKGDLTMKNGALLVFIDGSLIVQGNITVEEGGELYIVSSREFLPSKPPVLPPLPPRPPRPPIKPPIRSAIVAGNISVNGKLFIAKDTLSMCSENDGMNGIHLNSTSIFECYNATITAFSGEIPVSITNQKLYYEKSYYNFDIGGEAKIDNSKISYLYDGVRILNGSDAVVQNCEIFNSKADGIYVEGNAQPVIANNTIRDCSNAGIFINSILGKENVSEKKISANTNTNPGKAEDIWEVKTEMNVLPNLDGWTLKENYAKNCANVENGILKLDCTGENKYWYYEKVDNNLNNAVGTTLEVREKVISADDSPTPPITHNIEDGEKVFVIGLKANRVCLNRGDESFYEMDTTDDYHTYTLVTKGVTSKLYIDGTLRLTSNTPYADTTDKAVFIFGDTTENPGFDFVTKIDYLYYTTKGAFEPSYHPPTPIEGAGPWSIIATVGEVVEFDGSNYYDMELIEGWSWDFDASDGVGEDAIETEATHTYQDAGIYFVTLTVADTAGLTDMCYIRATIWDPNIWSVSDTTVSDCEYGIHLEDFSLNIGNCTLFNNDYGIYCERFSATVINSYVFDNNINSVYLSADSSMIPVNAAYDRRNMYIGKETSTPDGDDWSDEKELYIYGFSPYHEDVEDADFDEDGFINVEEGDDYGTDPLNPDTDNDEINDNEELNVYGTNPLNPDTDFDGLKDGEEVNVYHTEPLDPDTDDDSYNDGIDFNPLVDLTITVKIKEILAVDSIVPPSGAASIKSHAVIYIGYNGTWQINALPIALVNDPHLTPNEIPDITSTLNIPDDTQTASIKIDIQWSWIAGEFVYIMYGDLSKDPGIGACELTYDIKTGQWTGDDSVGDSNGYGHVSGNEDGSTATEENDCDLWFDIFINDNDNDGLAYWEEVNTLGTDPIAIDNPTAECPEGDVDNDGLPNWYERKYCTLTTPSITWMDGLTHDTTTDPDNDGLHFADEYFCRDWNSEPISQKDIFVEVDWMAGHEFTEEAQVMVMRAFSAHNIVLHIDDGWMGGGNQITYTDPFWLLRRDGQNNDFYDFKQNNFNINRQGIFRYCIFGHNYQENPNSSGATPSVNKVIDGDDFFVSHGLLTQAGIGSLGLAGTFLHELGHTLGLVPLDYLPTPFEGIDTEYHENYRSCMNFRYQFSLVDYSNGSRPHHDFDDWGHIDLTRVSTSWNIYEG